MKYFKHKHSVEIRREDKAPSEDWVEFIPLSSLDPTTHTAVVVDGVQIAMPIVLTYVQERRGKYPPLQDLADAIYWQSNGDASKMDDYLAGVEAIKRQYPKPV